MTAATAALMLAVSGVSPMSIKPEPVTAYAVDDCNDDWLHAEGVFTT